MYSRRSSFFEIVVKLPGFKGSGKIPVTNGSLMSLEIGILYFLKSLVGILFGPIDFLSFNALIMSSASSGDVGVKKKEFSDGFVR